MSNSTKSALRARVPVAGFVYAHDRLVLRRRRVDNKIRAALVAAAAKSATQVEQAFVAMFREASRLLDEDKTWVAEDPSSRTAILERLTTAEFVGIVWSRVPWASQGQLDEDTFIELFLCLRTARAEWHASPRPPFNNTEHGALAHAIDDFRRECGVAWGDDDVEDELFLLVARAPAAATSLDADDEDDDEDKDEDEHEDEEDVGMGDAEEEGDGVREAREALASAEMDEEAMDWE